MFPETNNGDDDTNGADNTAVVVDLTETDANKQAKPLTDVPSGDKGGNAEASDTEEQQRVNGSRDTGEDDDEELQGASKPWRKRLKREIRQKLEARATAAALTEENTRIRQENERLLAARETQAPDTKDLDSQLSALESDLAAAIEAGDSAKQAKLNVKIAQLTTERATRLAAPRRQEQRSTQQRAAPAKTAGPTPTGRAFIEANEDWWSDPEQAAARAAITAIDDSLIANGSDPNSERHYERIAKRAKEMGLKVKIRQPFDDGADMRNDVVDLEDEDEPPRRNQRRTAPMGNNGTSRQRVNTEVRDARAGKIVLDDAARETMRTFKLDPENPQHVRAFAKSRQERILQEAQS